MLFTLLLALLVTICNPGVTSADNPDQSGDILEQIGESLKTPEAEKKLEPYLGSLLNAMTSRDSYILYKELYLSGRYSDELGQTEGRNSLGFILFGTFAGPEGQLADLNVQFRATYYNNQFANGEKAEREYTDGLTDFKLELHNAFMRFRVLPPLLNIRIGHFYVPFGIQPWIDTHGTLLQSPAMQFIGLDRDWGIAIEGQNDTLEYQLGLTRGSGMDYFQQNNNYALAGKLSTPRIGEQLNDWLGISFLMGNIFDPMAVERLRSLDMGQQFPGNVVRKWRIGLDGQKLIGPLRLRMEIASGQDEKEEILGEFVEAKYSFGADNRWSTSLQWENLTQDINTSQSTSNSTVRGGLIYSFSANYNLQLVVSRDLDVIFGKQDTWIGLLFYGQKGGGWLDW